MIEAKHNKAAQYFFRIYIGRLLRKNFSNFFLANFLTELPENKSVLITPNHISWWDGFFVYEIINTLIKKNFHVVMLQEQLEKYWFFKYIGAYSINPKVPVSISNTIKYTDKLFNNSSNAIVFYPQGEIEAFDKMPLKLNHGLKLFLKGAIDKCVVLPVAFKIQHYNEKYPAIVFRAGRYINPNDIINDFNVFKEEFYSNINFLNESAFNQKFVGDLFKKRIDDGH